jgi:hypothetical protein
MRPRPKKAGFLELEKKNYLSGARGGVEICNYKKKN